MSYHLLDPLIIPIVKSDKLYGYLRLELQLATKDNSPIHPFASLFPVLLDAYFTHLFGRIGDRWIPGSPFNQETILSLLKDVTTKTLLKYKSEDHLTVYLKNMIPLL